MNYLESIATQVRRDIIRMVNSASSGHPGGSLSATDILTVLYFEIMDIKCPEFNMEGTDEDVFYLSNGHISPALYSILARRGYFSTEELASFRKINSRLQGHPSSDLGLPGVRISSGSLGQGLSCAIGHAIGKKLSNDNKTVFVMLGDGELQEGQIWEAAMYAGSNNVNNLIAIVDYNKQQIDGHIDNVLPLGNLKLKWESFDWEVIEINGNDINEVSSTLNILKNKKDRNKPVVILAHTEMGYGVDFMAGTNKWHGIAPDDTQTRAALSQLKETLGDY